MSKQSKFVLFKDASGQLRWHLKAGNGRIVCQGESHGTRQHALRAIQCVMTTSAAATVADGPLAPLSKPISKRVLKPAVKAVARKTAVKKAQRAKPAVKAALKKTQPVYVE